MPGDEGSLRNRVIIDTREDARMDDAVASFGLAVDRERLEIGDYLVGSTAIVERKTVRDFHLSLMSRRLWLQIGALRTTERWPYVLVEGADLDEGPLGPNQVRGAILSILERGVRVLRTRDLLDSARWLARLAARSGQARGVWRPHRSLLELNHAEAGPVAVLQAVAGVSTATACALLAQFGSIRGLLDAGREEWLGVPGVGPQRAAALEQALMLSRPPAPAPPPALPAKAQPPST